MESQEFTSVGLLPVGHADPEADHQGRTIVVPWHRITLGLVLLTAAILNCWQLDRIGYGNSYYAAAVRSMLESWHNFFFNSFDPGGFVTIDKPPLGFWFQVLSAKLFGYSGVSLMLPEALAGVLSVAVLYHLVQRVFGHTAGLLAGLMLALTPVAVVDNRNNIIDSILVLFMLLGAWAVSLAAETGKLRWLLLCAVVIGLAFNVKMLEAYLVVPACGLLYLLGAATGWRTRLIHLGLAVVVLLTVSLSWAVAVDLTPASQRPWVDSTTTNSEVDLAIGYNGLDRLLGRSFGRGAPGPGGPGGNPQVPGQTTQRSTDRATGAQQANRPAQNSRNFGGGGGGGGLFNNGQVGPFRLFNETLGGQIAWLLPLAAIGLIVGASRRLRLPLDQQQRSLVLWGTWLLTTGIFFSVANFFHSYYLVTMAPPVAALAGIGVVTLWKDYLRGPARLNWRWLALPVALVATAGGQAYLLNSYPDWSRWLTPLVLGVGIIAAGILVLARLRPRVHLRLWTPMVTGVGALALLIAPAAWAADTIQNGSGMLPSAGPSPASQFRGFGGGGGGRSTGGNRGRFGDFNFANPLAGMDATQLRNAFARIGGGDRGNGVNATLLRYLEQHQGSTRFLVAVTNSNEAAPYIIQTGKPVMSLGGFGGSDPILTTTQVAGLVANHTIRYFLLSGGFGRGGSVTQWVQANCTVVPSSAWQGNSNTSGGFGFGGGGAAGGPGTGNQPNAGGFGNAQGGGSGGPQGGDFGTTQGGGGSPQGNGSGNQGSFGGFGNPQGAGGFPGGFDFGGGQQLYDCAGSSSVQP